MLGRTERYFPRERASERAPPSSLVAFRHPFPVSVALMRVPSPSHSPLQLQSRSRVIFESIEGQRNPSSVLLDKCDAHRINSGQTLNPPLRSLNCAARFERALGSTVLPKIVCPGLSVFLQNFAKMAVRQTAKDREAAAGFSKMCKLFLGRLYIPVLPRVIMGWPRRPWRA